MDLVKNCDIESLLLVSKLFRQNAASHWPVTLFMMKSVFCLYLWKQKEIKRYVVSLCYLKIRGKGKSVGHFSFIWTGQAVQDLLLAYIWRLKKLWYREPTSCFEAFSSERCRSLARNFIHDEKRFLSLLTEAERNKEIRGVTLLSEDKRQRVEEVDRKERNEGKIINFSSPQANIFCVFISKQKQ